MSGIKDGFGDDVDDDVGGIALAYGVAPIDDTPPTVELTPELQAAVDFLKFDRPGEGMAGRLFDALKRIRELERELASRCMSPETMRFLVSYLDAPDDSEEQLNIWCRADMSCMADMRGIIERMRRERGRRGGGAHE